MIRFCAICGQYCPAAAVSMFAALLNEALISALPDVGPCLVPDVLQSLVSKTPVFHIVRGMISFAVLSSVLSSTGSLCAAASSAGAAAAASLTGIRMLQCISERKNNCSDNKCKYKNCSCHGHTSCSFQSLIPLTIIVNIKL